MALASQKRAWFRVLGRDGASGAWIRTSPN
jgi:hypothetical protein